MLLVERIPLLEYEILDSLNDTGLLGRGSKYMSMQKIKIYSFIQTRDRVVFNWKLFVEG